MSIFGVKRFDETAATHLLNILPTDVGRPIPAHDHEPAGGGPVAYAKAVLASGTSVDVKHPSDGDSTSCERSPDRSIVGMAIRAWS